MKKWIDPVKNRPAKESTMETRGDFREFTELMKKLVPAHHSETERLEAEKRTKVVANKT
jgi:hypothetical protein